MREDIEGVARRCTWTVALDILIGLRYETRASSGVPPSRFWTRFQQRIYPSMVAFLVDSTLTEPHPPINFLLTIIDAPTSAANVARHCRTARRTALPPWVAARSIRTARASPNQCAFWESADLRSPAFHTCTEACL